MNRLVIQQPIRRTHQPCILHKLHQPGAIQQRLARKDDSGQVPEPGKLHAYLQACYSELFVCHGHFAGIGDEHDRVRLLLHREQDADFRRERREYDWPMTG